MGQPTRAHFDDAWTPTCKVALRLAFDMEDHSEHAGVRRQFGISARMRCEGYALRQRGLGDRDSKAFRARVDIAFIGETASPTSRRKQLSHQTRCMVHSTDSLGRSPACFRAHHERLHCWPHGVSRTLARRREAKCGMSPFPLCYVLAPTNVSRGSDDRFE